jgi:rRNA maturation protein Nop10
MDVTGWYDADGPEYDCTWYALDDNCQLYGSELENFGYTANEACCVCGGGNTESTP